jgi:hypothetical protein
MGRSRSPEVGALARLFRYWGGSGRSDIAKQQRQQECDRTRIWPASSSPPCAVAFGRSVSTISKRGEWGSLRRNLQIGGRGLPLPYQLTDNYRHAFCIWVFRSRAFNCLWRLPLAFVSSGWANQWGRSRHRCVAARATLRRLPNCLATALEQVARAGEPAAAQHLEVALACAVRMHQLQGHDTLPQQYRISARPFLAKMLRDAEAATVSTFAQTRWKRRG